MLACVETLAPLETNLVPSLANQLAQFGRYLGQVIIPRSSSNWGTTSHVNAKYEESMLWWTLGVKQVLPTSVVMGRRKNLFFYGIKLCVISHITLHPLVYILKYEIYFLLEFLRKRKNQKKKDVSHACAEASHLSMIWRVLLIKYFQIGIIFCNNISHLIRYFL